MTTTTGIIVNKTFGQNDFSFEVLDYIKRGVDTLPLTHTIAYESLWKKGAIDNDGLTDLGINMLEKFIEVEFGS